MKSFVVNLKENGKKLNSVIKAHFPELSFSDLRKALRKKDIKINEKRIHEDCFLKEKDFVSIYLPDSCFEKKAPPIPILFEDDNILVVNKPVKIETEGPSSLTTFLQKQITTIPNFPAPCHRLDRNTTGLILYAKHPEALSILLDSFQKHEIEKHYIAAVYGIMPKKEETLVSYLFKDRKKSLVYISDEPKKGYQKIVTKYLVKEEHRKENYSVLDITLETGKTHQIRAHLAHIGHPILGDGKYGRNEINKNFSFKTQQLCSYSLQFSFQEDKGILQYLNHKKITLF